MSYDSGDEVPELLVVDDPEPEAGPSSLLRALTTQNKDAFARRKIPLTLLTGYLGAGKSTLLEYILTADHGFRIAVCMNDFGDTTDIEAKALTLSDPTTGEQSTSFLSLPNGCLCCSVKDLGIAAIEEMVVNQRDKVDWVMVELTGVADPGPIAKSFWENEEMGDLTLDGIICVVDSKNLIRHLDELSSSGSLNEAQKQLAASDVILLNRIDLVDPAYLAQVRSRVQSLNPTLKVYETVRGKMPLGNIFNLRAYSDSTAPELHFLRNEPNGPENGTDRTDRRLKQSGDRTGHILEDDLEDHDRNHDHNHDHDDKTGQHLNGISTIMIPLPTLSQAQWQQLNLFIETVLWEGRLPSPIDGSANGDMASRGTEDGAEMTILRCKGLIRVEDGREMMLQGVMDIFELSDVSKNGGSQGGQSQALTERQDERGNGKIVFIGKGVQFLESALLAFLDQS